MSATALLRRALAFFFCALFIVVPLVFTSVNEELFEFNKMLAVYIITIGIASCWVMICVIERKLVWKKTPFDIPIALFVGSQVLATIFSINIHTSIFGYYTRFNGGLLSVISYTLIYYAFVTFVEKKQLFRYISALLVGGVLSALYALPEHFGHSPSCLIFSGRFDVACWVQDVKSRVFGTFGQPNWLAAYLGMLLPLAIVNTKTITLEVKLLEEDTTKKWVSFLVRASVVFLFCAVLFFTGSRSGIGGVAGGLALLGLATGSFIYLIKKRKLDRSYQQAVGKYLQILGVACFIFLLSIIIFPNPVADKLAAFLPHPSSKSISVAPTATTAAAGSSQLELGGSDSGVIREVVWKGALRVWQRYPIFGSGVETFAYSYYKDRLKEHNTLSEWDFLYNKAHNEFLNYLATTGLVGFLTYVLLLGFMIILPIVYAFKPFFKKEHNKHEPVELITHDTFLLVSLASGIIIVSISNFFGFSTVMVSTLLYVFSAIAVVITHEGPTQNMGSSKSTQIMTQENDPITAPQYAALIAIFISAIFMFSFIWKLWTADVAYAKGKQLDNAGQYEAALPYLRQAVETIPDEPTFRDEYSNNLAFLAVTFAQQKDISKASDFASQAIAQSDLTIAQNGVHTNFWKTRIRVFLTLSQLDQHFYTKAQDALQTAHDLSPTDPKLVYYLALLAQAQNDNAAYQTYLLQAIDLKPNYEEARTSLAKLYESQGQNDKALEQYKYMIQFINPNNLSARAKVASLSALKK